MVYQVAVGDLYHLKTEDVKLKEGNWSNTAPDIEYNKLKKNGGRGK